MRLITILFFVPTVFFAGWVDTFYGPLDIQEPVLIELIESEPFQRLKGVRQYGVSYFCGYEEEYTRYDHSIGVFALLRKKGRPLQEQIAGLLHDVSHTVFSHVGDFIFPQTEADDYQNSIHAQFLAERGLGEILAKYGFTIDEVLPDEKRFPGLKTPGPDLCADRIDYNLQGAYYRGFLSKQEALEIFEDLTFVGSCWVCSLPSLMKKMAQFSLFMTERCWGSPFNFIASSYLAQSLLRSLDLGIVSLEEIHFGQDQRIWDLLKEVEDPIIQEKISCIPWIEDSIAVCEPSEAELYIRSKFRGIDPWIIQGEETKRMTEIDPAFRSQYFELKEKMDHGFWVRLNPLHQKKAK